MLHILKKAIKEFSKPDSAVKIYERQVNAIQEIKDTRGFEEITKWWEDQYTKSDDLIDTLSGEALALEVMNRKIIKKHLTWIYNLKK